jgi:hypothetical protein
MLAPIFAAPAPGAEEELRPPAKRCARPRCRRRLRAMNWGAYTTHRDPVLSLYADSPSPNNPKRSGRPRARHVTIDPAQRPSCCRTTS